MKDWKKKNTICITDESTPTYDAIPKDLPRGISIQQIKESITQADGGQFASHKEIKEEFAKWGLDIDKDPLL